MYFVISLDFILHGGSMKSVEQLIKILNTKFKFDLDPKSFIQTYATLDMAQRGELA